MSLEIKLLVLTVTLISFSVVATADIIVQPGYDKIPTERPPIHSESSMKPTQHQREAEFGHTKAHLIPIHANEYRDGIQYQVGHPFLHYAHYPYYPRYIHAWPRHVPERHLRYPKIHGKKIFQPNWYDSRLFVPMSGYRRYKRSIEEQPDPNKVMETIPNSKDSSVNKFRSDVMENEGNVYDQQSKNNVNTMGSLFGLNPANYMNSENLEIKINTLDERNTDENNNKLTENPESNVDKATTPVLQQPDSQVDKSSSRIPPDEPSLKNFPDPRPDIPEHKTSHKSTTKPIPKNSVQEKPLLGSSITVDEISESKHVHKEYPSPSTYNYYYNLPPYGNYAPPPVSYLPVYLIRYGACNDDTSKTYSDQQSGIQEQIHQAGAIRVTGYPPNMGYAFSPQIYNYGTSYALRYPELSHYATSPYPISYL